MMAPVVDEGTIETAIVAALNLFSGWLSWRFLTLSFRFPVWTDNGTHQADRSLFLFRDGDPSLNIEID